jgi:hypothetical protein
MTYRQGWPGPWCGRCNRRNVVAWDVFDAVWIAVVRGRWNVLCPTCFDEEAQIAGVPYHSNPGTELITWSDWLPTSASASAETPGSPTPDQLQ